jgi:hypothetical protein
MARRRTQEEKAAFREQAVAMRRAGIGASRIARDLGIGKGLVTELLRGEPPPASLLRARAKDDLRETALALRAEGRTYDEIRAELGCSKSSLSLWLRHLPHPTADQRSAVGTGLPADSALEVTSDAAVARARRAEGCLLHEIASELGRDIRTVHGWCRGLPVPARADRRRRAEELRQSGRAYWAAERARREGVRRAEVERHAERVGRVDERELALLVAVAYWCEGTKSKPWRRNDRLVFVNSDPDLIRLVVAWLAGRGVGLDRCRLTVSIHESGNVAAATEYWAGVLGAPVSSFTRPSLKRHNPKTARKNTGASYVGCLVIGVRQSRELYLEIEGLWRGLVRGLGSGVGDHAASAAD